MCAPAAPPPEVVFSAPTEGEGDVSLCYDRSNSVLARHCSSRSVRGHVASQLSGVAKPESVESPPTPTAEFTAQYNGANRVARTQIHEAPRTFSDAEDRPSGWHPGN